jgi:hypothetical protein
MLRLTDIKEMFLQMRESCDGLDCTSIHASRLVTRITSRCSPTRTPRSGGVAFEYEVYEKAATAEATNGFK